MSDGTGIDYLDATWNVTTGCTPIMAGCVKCWAKTMAGRMWGKRPFGEVRCHEDRLTQPLHWKRPRRIGVTFMGDLLHKDVPFEFIDKVMAVIALCPQHEFVILTKRAKRRLEYMLRTGCSIEYLEQSAREMGWTLTFDLPNGRRVGLVSWPLPNLIQGISASNQADLDALMGDFLVTPAARRIVSLEPLVGHIDITPYVGSLVDAPEETAIPPEPIQGVIIGCESIGGRVGRLPGGTEQGYWDAAISLAAQCKAAGVALWHKQGPVNGRVCHDPAKWPAELREQTFPEVTR